MEEPSKIEDIKKNLYSRSAPDVQRRRRMRFHQKEYDVEKDWQLPQEEPLADRLNEQYEDHRMSFFTKLLIGSAIFFVLAVGIGIFVFFSGGNIVSANNVDIQVTGPVSVSGGDILPLEVSVVNKNNVALQVVDLAVSYPAGTAEADNPSKELKSSRQMLGDINPGSSAQATVRSILYGEENSKKEITFRIEYRVVGSSSTFKKEKTFDVLINSSPISLTVSSFDEINSGQEVDLTVTLASNSKDTLRDLLLKAQYPFGFTYVSSDVKPVFDTATWKIGDLPSGSKKTIRIKGKIEGQDEEERIFRFNVGTQSTKSERTIGTQFVMGEKTVVIKRPFITVNLSVEGDATSNDYIGEFNDPLDINVEWFNNLPTAIIDGEIRVKLSGNAYDKVSVNPLQGLFRSENNEIIWNKVTTPELASVGAGQSGRVSFRLTPRDASAVTGRATVNPSILIDTSVQARRVSESNVPEEVRSTVSRNVKVASNISLAATAFRSSGPFTNTGPIPPRAEQSTTYTIVWTAYNSSSRVGNAIVTSRLPAYVKWTGVTNGVGSIVYNSNDNNITWNIGDIPAFDGTSNNRKEMSFQVSLQPSVSQVGQVPELIESSVLTASDTYTDTELRSTRPAITTRLQNDPSFRDGDAAVVR